MSERIHLRADGPAPDVAEAQGGCHCGAVRFRATLAQGLGSAGRCTCSCCRMKGSISVTVADGGFRLLSGEGGQGTCRFGSGIAAHHFCRVCRINTHHHRSSVPGQVAVSAACLDGVSPFDFLELPVWDGERETSGDGDLLAGVLRYSPA